MTVGDQNTMPKTRNFSALIQDTINTYIKNFKPLFLIALITNSINLLWTFVSLYMEFFLNINPNTSIFAALAIIGPVMFIAIILILAAVILYTLSTAASIIVISDYTSGKITSLSDALSKASDKIVPLIIGHIVVFFRIIGGMLLFIVPGILASLNNAFYQQCIVLENKDGSQGARRSRELVLKQPGKITHPRWYLIGMFLIVMGIALGISGIVNMPALILTFLKTQSFEFKSIIDAASAPEIRLLQALLTFVGNSLVFPIYIVFSTLFFQDLKARRDYHSTGSN